VPAAAFRWVHGRQLSELGLRGGFVRNLRGGHLIGCVLAGTALGIELWACSLRTDRSGRGGPRA
jgi:hypothetical protein